MTPAARRLVRPMLIGFCLAGLSPPVPTSAQLNYVGQSAGLDTPALDEGNTEFEFADLNQDGHLDLVTIGDHGSPGLAGDAHGITVWFGDGVGGWSAVSYGDFGYGGVAVGDVNGDGQLDVGYGMHHNYAGQDLGDQLIEVALGDGTGQLWTPWDDGLATNGESWGMFGTDFADVDNDGDLDLGAASFGGTNGARIYLNNGDGTWTQSSAQVGGNATTYFYFGDVNGDGHADFAAEGGSATIRLGDGTGSFTVGDGNLPAPSYRYGISLGDVNADGRDDLAYLESSGRPRVFTLTSPGNWQDLTGNLPTVSANERLQIADMDLDGYGDLVVFAPGSSDTPGTVRVYCGDGAGNWTPCASFSTPANSGAQALRSGYDADHNGYPDLVLVQDEDYFLPPFFHFRKNYPYFYAETSTPSAEWVHPVGPRGGETWHAGSVRFIDWTAAVPGPGLPTMSIELSTTGPTGPWTTVATAVPNNGRYQWLVPATTPGSTDCYLRLTAGTASATTPAPFSIVGGSLLGDFDDDGDVDLDDYTLLAPCLLGPQTGYPASCTDMDLDTDLDVDLTDVATWVNLLGS